MIAYSELVAQMNRWLPLAPPKVKLAVLAAFQPIVTPVLGRVPT
jgi:hypothetical protein